MVKAATGPKIVVDKEFADLIPKIGTDEFAQLETNILRDGVLDKLITWDRGDKLVLLDGHNRLKICNQHGKPFEAKRLPFESRDEARNWMIRHQLGRRNITDEQRRYLLGKLYAEHKPEQGRPKNTEKTGSEKPEPDSGLTAESLAEAHGVSERTVRKAADFAEAVDAVAEKCPELKAAVLAGEVKATTADLEALAEAPKRVVESVAKKVANGDRGAIKDAVAEREPGDDTESIAADKTKRSQQATAKRNNGRQVIDPKKRKEALDMLGKVGRTATAFGIYDECRPLLDSLIEAFEGAGK